MPMQMPAGTTSAAGDFLGRIEYDARVGFWRIVKRVQQPGGKYADDAGEQFKNPTFLMDFGTLQHGWISFAVTPEFRLKPYGQDIGEQPADTFTDKEGKLRPKFNFGVRVKVAGRVFGDADAYYWTLNAKIALSGFEDLYNVWELAPEAVAGQIPVVECVKTLAVKMGQGTFHKPVFAIQKWMDRLSVFGDRTVPPPAATAPVARPVQSVPTPQPASAVAMPWDEAPPAAKPEPATASTYEF